MLKWFPTRGAVRCAVFAVADHSAGCAALVISLYQGLAWRDHRTSAGQWCDACSHKRPGGAVLRSSSAGTSATWMKSSMRGAGRELRLSREDCVAGRGCECGAGGAGCFWCSGCCVNCLGQDLRFSLGYMA